VAAGERALQRGDWQAACIAFEAALDKSATAEALEGLGVAHWWLNHLDEATAIANARMRSSHAAVSMAEPPGPPAGWR
jgi:hypothetical protein